MKKYTVLLGILLTILFMLGCSGNSADPVAAGSDDTAFPFTGSGNGEIDHSKWISGTIEFDLDSMTAEVTLDRDTEAHINVAPYVSTSIMINSLDLVDWIVDVDFTITNRYPFDGYDVRLIIFTDMYGHTLKNPDNWTPLHDIPGGQDINPFKAFAKGEPNRIFEGMAEHTENLIVAIPDGNTMVQFAVDASYPTNASEPYQIKDFAHDFLEADTTSSAPASIDVLSWGNDVNAVSLNCPAVCGPDDQMFNYVAGNNWELTLDNNESAPEGDYEGMITATTSSSGTLALYDYVNVHVSEPITGKTYVGSSVCKACHSELHNEWSYHGHGYALNQIDGSAPVLPFSAVPDPPLGLTWDEISFVQGGYKTVAAFLNQDGYLVTGSDTLWNVKSNHFSEFMTPDRGIADYNCGQCHTTGWQSIDENGGLHQDGLIGIQGTFSEPGVGCEECHGPGSEHVQSPSPDNIIWDNSNELCASCHSKGISDRIYANDDNLLDSAQQYNEMINQGQHGEWGCWFCHTSHASSYYEDEAPGWGEYLNCGHCHSAAEHQVGGSMQDTVECLDCHMPNASLGGEASGEGLHATGDVRSHLWAIDTTGRHIDDYFETDGEDKWVKPFDDGKYRLNLAYACFQCHDGTQAFEFTDYSFPASYASGIHDQ